MGSTKTQETKLPEWQENFIRENILPMAEGIADTPFKQYTGDLVQGFSPLQDQAAGIYGDVSANQLATTNLDPYMSPYQQNVIDASLRTLRENQATSLNQLDAQASSSGAFGGSRHGVVQAEALKGFDRSARDLVTNQMQAGYMNAQQAAQSDMDRRMQQAGAMMQTGEAQRALGQAQLQADYAQFQAQQGHPLTQLNALLAGASGIPQGLGTVSTHDPFGGLTAVGSVLSGVGAVGQGGGFGAMFGGSDVRLKENIQPIEEVSGIQFYTWDWNDEGKRIGVEKHPTIGVMAQELEAKHPDLVVIGDDGYRRVDYGGLFKRIGR
jgi:hypothetical protein